MGWSTYTQEEDELIWRLRLEEGWTFREIAKKLRRSHDSVYNRFRDLEATLVSGARLKRQPPK